MADTLTDAEIDALDVAPPPSSSRSLAGKFVSDSDIDAIPEARPEPPPPAPPTITPVDNTVRSFRDTNAGSTQVNPPPGPVRAVPAGDVEDVLTGRTPPPAPLPAPKGSFGVDFGEAELEPEGMAERAVVGGMRTAGRVLGVGGKTLAATGEDVLEAPAQIAGYQEPFRNIKSYINGAMPIEDVIGGTAPMPGETPFEKQSDQEHGLQRFLRKAYSTVLEVEPRLAAGYALGAAGAPASISAGLPMLVTDEGQFDPVGAAIAMGLPGVAHAGEDAVARLLAKAPITRVVVQVLGQDPLKLKGKVVQQLGNMELSNDAWRRFLEAGGGFLAANAYLAATTGVRNAAEIAKMTPEQRTNFILDNVAGNLAPALLGFIRPGLSKTLEYKAPEINEQFQEMIKEQQRAASTEPKPSEPSAPGLRGPGEPTPPPPTPAPSQPAPSAPITNEAIDAIDTERQPTSVPGQRPGTVQQQQNQATPETAVAPADTGNRVPGPARQPAATPQPGWTSPATPAATPTAPAPAVTAHNPVTPQDFIDLNPIKIREWRTQASYGPDSAEKIAAGWTVGDVLGLLESRDMNVRMSKAQQENADKALKEKDDAKANKLQLSAATTLLKAKTLNELIMAIPEVSKAIQGMMPDEAEKTIRELAAKAWAPATPATTPSKPETKAPQPATKPPEAAPKPPQAETPAPAPKPALPPSIRPKTPKAPAPVAEKWKEVGKNAKGQTVFEDDRGVRSIVSGGARITEPVSLVPTRGPDGRVVYATGTGDRKGTDFETVTAPVSSLTGRGKLSRVQKVRDLIDRLEKRADRISKRVDAMEDERDLLKTKDEREKMDLRIERYLDIFNRLDTRKAKLTLTLRKAESETILAAKGAKPTGIPPKSGTVEANVEPIQARFAAVEYWVNQDIIDSGKQPNGKKATAKEIEALKERQKQVLENYRRALAGESPQKPVAPTPPKEQVTPSVEQPTEGGGSDSGPGGNGPAAPGTTGPVENTGTANPPAGASVQPGVRPPNEGTGSPGGGASTREPAPDVVRQPSEQEPPPVNPSSDTGSPEGTGPLPTTVPAADPPVAVDLGGQLAPENWWMDDNPAPTGPVARIEANIEAIATVRQIEAKGKVTDADRFKLQMWSGWGAFAELFNEGRAEKRDWDASWMKRYGRHYDKLQKLLTPDEFNAAAMSSVNANYTSGEVVRFMWKLAERLGFKGGQALESATGSGVFVAMTPADLRKSTRWTGVEMDIMTGKIFHYLHPQVDFRPQPFEKAKLPNGFFDLNITNVPFFEVGPGAEYPDLNLHNYFIARGMDKLRPGGIAIVITSANTMEARQEQRSLLVTKGQLLGAIRLPNTAFKESGGTEVVTDILVLRKPDGKPAEAQKWEFQLPIEISGEEFRVNEYFISHPEMVLGKHSMTGTMWKKNSYTVEPTPGPLGEKLEALLEKFPENLLSPEIGGLEVASTTQLEDHTLVVNERGQVMESMNFQLGLPTQWDSSSGTLTKRAKLYVGLRDVLRKQYRIEEDPEATEEQIEANRKELNKVYQALLKELDGTINGSPRKMNYLADDPYYATVHGIERSREMLDPKDDTKTITVVEPADVLSKRVRHPDQPPKTADNATDALGISLAYKGELDMDFVSQLTGLDNKQIESELIGNNLAYLDPDTGKLETTNEYLSGDVRDKLAKAIFSAKESPTFQRNVDGLRAVIPETIPFERIKVEINARWTPPQVLNKFAEAVMGLEGDPIAFVPTVETFSVKMKAARHTSTLARTQWTTERMAATDLLEHALNFRNPEVVDYVEDAKGNRKKVVNTDQTAAARQMVDKIKEAFQTYIHTSKDLVSYRYFDDQMGQYKTEGLPIWDVMEREFNRRTNSFVKPSYDGSVLKLPGLSDQVLRKQHLLNGVMRAQMEGSAVFAHGVGSGKTFLAIVVGHELQRIGKAKRFMIWAKKSTMGQYRVSIERAYPGSKVLIPNAKDFKKENRRKLAARIASGNWDFIVLTHENAKAIRPGEHLVQQLFNEQIEALRRILKDMGAESAEYAKNTRGQDPAVRNIVKKLSSLKKRLEKHGEAAKKHQDTGLNWEDLGIDGLWVDESHNFKNIPIPTQMDNSVKGIPNSFSQRAVDMLIKVRDVQRRTNGRNVFFASGTPVANTLAELWVQFYATNPALLKQFSVETFDAFATTFADIVTNYEFGWDENFKNVTRMSRFKNPVGLTMLTQMGMDVQIGNKELGLDVPDVVGGAPQIVVVPVTPPFNEWRTLLTSIIQAWNTAEPIERYFNSWVPIATMRAGLAAATDPRLINPNSQDHPESKTNTIVKAVIKAWEEGKERRTTMMILCDLYRTLNTSKLRGFVGGEAVTDTPESEEPEDETDESSDSGDTGVKDEAAYLKNAVGVFNLYDDVRNKLIAAGIPENEIAIAYEHDTDVKRDTLFNKVRAGAVRILIGSTEKIGEGVDVPQRMSHQFHFDPPMQMTAAKLEQRIGRIIRQGNLHSPKNWNLPVHVNLYATERSMDRAIYNLLFGKATMTLQALKGMGLGDTFDDPASDFTLALAQMVAASSGDDRALRLAQLTNEVRQLEQQQSAYLQRMSQLRKEIDVNNGKVESMQEMSSNARKLAEAITKATANDETIKLLQTRTQDSRVGLPAINEWLKAAQLAMKDAVKEPEQSVQMALLISDNVRALLRMDHKSDIVGHEEKEHVFVKGPRKGEKEIQRIPIRQSSYPIYATFWLGGPDPDLVSHTIKYGNSIASMEQLIPDLRAVPAKKLSDAEWADGQANESKKLVIGYTEQLNTTTFPQADELKLKRSQKASLEKQMSGDDPWMNLDVEATTTAPPLLYRMLARLRELEASSQVDRDDQARSLMRSQLELNVGDRRKAMVEARQLDANASITEKNIETLKRRILYAEKVRYLNAKPEDGVEPPELAYAQMPMRTGRMIDSNVVPMTRIMDIGEPQETTPGQSVQAQGIQALHELFSRADTGLSGETRRVALAMLDQPALQDLNWDKLHVSIQDRLSGGGSGNAALADWLIEMARGARPQTFPHEVFHFLWEMLPPEEQERVNNFRLEEIEKSSLPESVKAKIRGEGVSSRRWLSLTRGLSPSIVQGSYYLSSPQEYLAGIGGDKAARDLGQKQSLWQRIKAWLQAIMDALRRIIRRPSMGQIIRDLLAGRYRNTPATGRDAEDVILGDIAPPEDTNATGNAGVDPGTLDLQAEIGKALEEAEGEGAETRVFGRVDKILGRQGIGETERAQGSAHAAAVFARAGLQIEQQENGLWALADDEADQEAAGRRLLKLLETEISSQNQRGMDSTGYLGNLLNSVVENFTTDWNHAFSPQLKRDLYAVAQGERSHRGVMLAALQGFSNSVAYVARNVDVVLNRQYSEEYGGDFIRSIIDRVTTYFRDYFTEQEIQDALHNAPALQSLIDKVLALNRRQEGSRLYKRAQAALAPKAKKQLAALEADARIQEAFREILQQLKPHGIEPPPNPNKPLTPLQQVLLLVHPKSEEKINLLIDKAISDAERNAGIKHALSKAEDDEERQAMMEGFAGGDDPSPEDVEAGLETPEFNHWKVLRDVIDEYSPVTVRLVQDLLKTDFRGTQFKPAKARPADTRINLEALAKSPEAETERLLQAYMTNLEANIDLAHATPGTRDKVMGLVETQLTEQLEAARKRVREPMFQEPPKKGAKLTPEQRIGQLVNAGLFGDERLNVRDMVERVAAKSPIKRLQPQLSDLIRQAMDVPFYNQKDLGRNFAQTLIEKLGVSTEQANNAAEVFEKAFADKFALARAKAAKRASESLTPKERVEMGPKKALWQKIIENVNAGNFDSGAVLQSIARSKGWHIPTEAEVAKMKELAERMMRLRELTQGERDAAGDNPADIEKAQREHDAKVLERRVAIKKQIETMWARMTKPMSWRHWWSTRRNWAQALNEYEVANLLFKIGFPVRLATHITTQLLWHIPTRGIAEGVIRYADDKAAGREARMWADIGKTLRDAYADTWRSMKPALEAARAALAGRAEARNVDRLMSGVQGMERLIAKADELWATGGPANKSTASVMYLMSLVRFSLRITQALDSFQGTPAEIAEMRQLVVSHLRANGRSPAEAEALADGVIGNADDELPKAMADVWADFSVSSDKAPSMVELRESARLLAMARMYQRARELGLPADDFAERTRLLRRTIAWQERTMHGPGGLMAMAGKGATKILEGAGLPFSFARFANAMGTGINYYLMFTPLYALANVPVGASGPSPWFKTRTDRAQRRVQAMLGSMFGALFFTLAALGFVLVRRRLGESKEERDQLIAQGHREYTVEFPTGDGSFMPFSLSVGWLSPFAPYLAAGGAVRDLMEKRQKQQDKLNDEAEKTGLEPGKVHPVTAGQVLGVVWAAAEETLMGGRTATGLSGAVSNEGVPNVNKTVASYFSAATPGLPAYQEIARMMGINLDSKLASVGDFMVPLPTSQARAVNVLGDPVKTPDDIQRIVQTITAGSYGLGGPIPVPFGTVKPNNAESDAYGALASSGYRPPSINPDHPYDIDGTYRPMTDKELEAYTVARGREFKAALADLGPDADAGMVKAAYTQANEQALASVGASTVARAATPSSAAAAPPVGGLVGQPKPVGATLPGATSVRGPSAPAGSRPKAMGARRARLGVGTRSTGIRGPSIRARGQGIRVGRASMGRTGSGAGRSIRRR